MSRHGLSPQDGAHSGYWQTLRVRKAASLEANAHSWGRWGRRTRNPLPPQRTFLQGAQHSSQAGKMTQRGCRGGCTIYPAYEENWIRKLSLEGQWVDKTDRQAPGKSQGQKFFSLEEHHGQKRENKNATVHMAPTYGWKDGCPLKLQ